MPYRASLGYTSQNGILKTTNMERSTLAVGLDPSFLNNQLKISFNVKEVIPNKILVTRAQLVQLFSMILHNLS